MIIIPAVVIDDVVHPSRRITREERKKAVKITCDGENYIIYESADEVPQGE